MVAPASAARAVTTDVSMGNYEQDRHGAGARLPSTRGKNTALLFGH